MAELQQYDEWQGLGTITYEAGEGEGESGNVYLCTHQCMNLEIG